MVENNASWAFFNPTPRLKGTNFFFRGNCNSEKNKN